eukprot:353695-Chlamydomonas_euryale.AAC.12
MSSSSPGAHASEPLPTAPPDSHTAKPPPPPPPLLKLSPPPPGDTSLPGLLPRPRLPLPRGSGPASWAAGGCGSGSAVRRWSRVGDAPGDSGSPVPECDQRRAGNGACSKECVCGGSCRFAGWLGAGAPSAACDDPPAAAAIGPAATTAVTGPEAEAYPAAGPARPAHHGRRPPAPTRPAYGAAGNIGAEGMGSHPEFDTTGQRLSQAQASSHRPNPQPPCHAAHHSYEPRHSQNPRTSRWKHPLRFNKHAVNILITQASWFEHTASACATYTPDERVETTAALGRGRHPQKHQVAGADQGRARTHHDGAGRLHCARAGSGWRARTGRHCRHPVLRPRSRPMRRHAPGP